MMRLSVTVLTAALVTGSLVACSNGYVAPPTASTSADGSTSKTIVSPVELHSSAILAKIHAAAGLARAGAVTPGIYTMVGASATGTQTIYAYPDPDSSNGPPVCSIGPLQNTRGSIAVDRKGDLLVSTGVEYGTSTVTIYKGPGLCGPELDSLTDPYGGYAIDVASRDAQSGKIVVGFRDRRAGVTICTLSGGCTARLEAPTLRNVFAVAIAPNGDCWASGWNGGTTILAYFAQCRHRGVIATGYQRNTFGYFLDIDGNGNLVTTGLVSHSSLYIYSGCNPACSLVGGPFQVNGCCGHLDANSKHLVVSESTQLDIYSYSTSGIKYLYSISNGLASGFLSGAAFSPSSKE